ncbi:Aste57867_22841 [Aphanomyces stellatus]|uniref:Aste57867_22841 protein n=1 Tax=Aphanomyces stellatus TaxID=120398 RepID=A0A485LLU9_9STRA|nr:hypothetical protein As57867_022770 [Aphanomyces stellatus]VFT99492.1 Aste57867_22841 [Aphanomyces stellatus]
MTSVLRKEWKKYFLAFNGVVLGVPLATGAYFVHNLRTDERFREHFHDKYPDLIDTLHEYVGVFPDAAPRDDIGEADPAAFKMPVHAKVQLKSGKSIVLEMPFDATIQDVHKRALAEHAHDAVLTVDFQDDDEGVASVATTAASTAAVAAPAPFADAPQSTWPTTYTPRSKRAPTDPLGRKLTLLRAKETALQAEKRAGGREIDAIEDDLRAVEAQKAQIKAQMPRKRFLGLF